MPATVTTLEREIVREERCVGLPTDQPLTPAAIAHRRIHIATLMLVCACVAIFAVFTAIDAVHMGAIALAGGFGLYAISQDQHLGRLAALNSDAQRIQLVVADELMCSGALHNDRELLDLREAAASGAGALAGALGDVVPADCARVRLVGPSGEVPIAAERGIRLADDPALASRAIRECAPVRRTVANRTVVVVPMWRGKNAVAVLEILSRPGAQYQQRDVALVDAFARGAVAALNILPSVWSSRAATH